VSGTRKDVSGKRAVTLSAVEESVTLSAVEESVTLSEARGLLPNSGHYPFVSTDSGAPSRCNGRSSDRASVPSLRSGRHS
jgi:hypothetical protein